jgi:hypothetical protein
MTNAIRLHDGQKRSIVIIHPYPRHTHNTTQHEQEQSRSSSLISTHTNRAYDSIGYHQAYA